MSMTLTYPAKFYGDRSVTGGETGRQWHPKAGLLTYDSVRTTTI